MSSPPVVADDTVTEEQKRGKKRFKIAGMKINSLRSIAKHFGLGGKGKKKELIARIEGADVDLEEAVDVAGEALADSPGQTSQSRNTTADDRKQSAVSSRMTGKGLGDELNEDVAYGDGRDDEYDEAKLGMKTLTNVSIGEPATAASGVVAPITTEEDSGCTRKSDSLESDEDHSLHSRSSNVGSLKAEKKEIDKMVFLAEASAALGEMPLGDKGARSSSDSQISPQSVTSTPLLDQKGAFTEPTVEDEEFFVTDTVIDSPICQPSTETAPQCQQMASECAPSLAAVEGIQNEVVTSATDIVVSYVDEPMALTGMQSELQFLEDELIVPGLNAEELWSNEKLGLANLSSPFPLTDRLSKFISPCSSSLLNIKPRREDSIVVNDDFIDLSALKTSLTAATQVDDLGSVAPHLTEGHSLMSREHLSLTKLDEIENLQDNANCTEKSIEIKCSDLKSQLDSLKTRFDKMATPQVREYLVLSESSQEVSLVLSVNGDGDINLAKIPSSSWRPNFSTFSSFDNINEVPPEEKAVTQAVLRNRIPGSAYQSRIRNDTSQVVGVVSHHQAATSSILKTKSALYRRGAMTNSSGTAGVLATFAAGAVAEEQKMHYNSATKQATVPSNVATPVQSEKRTEEKKLSPPVTQPFLALTEEAMHEREEEKKRMEKRLHGLHYGRASLGIKKSLTPPHSIAPLHGSPVHSTPANKAEMPAEKRDRDRQSSPARMETPRCSSSNRFETKATPQICKTNADRANGRVPTASAPKAVAPTRRCASTVVKPSNTKFRNGAVGSSSAVKPMRKTPEIIRSKTTRVGTQAPPPSYARSSSVANSGPKNQVVRSPILDDRTRESLSPKRVHKNPFGAML